MATSVQFERSAPQLAREFEDKVEKLIATENGPAPPELEKICDLLDVFQELPQILDASLEKTVTQLARRSLNTKETWPFRILYSLCKVRGHKIVSRFLPSEAANLLVIAEWTEQCSKELWQTRYCLLLWLSELLRAPFPLTTFGDDTAERCYRIARQYLGIPGKERDASAMAIARLASRSDTAAEYATKVFSEATHSWTDGSLFLRVGILQVTALMLQLSSPGVILKNALVLNTFLELILEPEAGSNARDSASFEKLRVKNAGRLALIVLNASVDAEDAGDIVERILGFLLQQLGHRDTIVRYAASKAIARIASRLPEEVQGDVITEVLDVFQRDILYTRTGEPDLDQVSSNEWHGCLLCLAELARRRLLSVEEHLPTAGQVLSEAAFFEQKRLTFAMGANVRDATCYVYWSLFRTYSRLDKVAVGDNGGDFLHSSFAALVGLCCFDREVNVRRAASAALQEGIGRQNWETANGLEIIQKLDYFRVGSRSRAYTSVALDACKLGFRHSVFATVVKLGVYSWDPAVRRLAAVSLRQLCSKYGTTEHQLQELLSKYSTVDYDVRHGTLLAVAELLSGSGRELKSSLRARVFAILNDISERELRDDNEVLHSEGFLRVLAYFVSNWYDLDEVQRLVDTKVGIAMEVEEKSVVDSVKILMDALPENALKPNVTSHWCSRATANKKTFAIALGLLKSPSDDVLRAMAHALTSNAVDISVKAELLTGLANLVSSRNHKDPKILALFVEGLDNYTVDARGDIGATVRERAIAACETLYPALSEFRLHVLASLLRISLEVLPRLRIIASATLSRVCDHMELSARLSDEAYSGSTNPANAEEALELIDAEQQVTRPEYFACALKTLDAEVDAELKKELVKGLTASVGAMQAGEATLQAAYQGLIDYLRRGRLEATQRFLLLTASLVDLKHEGARTTLCALRTLVRLFQSGLEIPKDAALFHKIYVKAYNAHINTKAIPRITAAVQVFAGLASQGHADSLKRLTVLCKHRFPPIRDEAARALYETLTVSDDINGATLQALETLEETDWLNSDMTDLDEAVQNLGKAIEGCVL